MLLYLLCSLLPCQTLLHTEMLLYPFQPHFLAHLQAS